MFDTDDEAGNGESMSSSLVSGVKRKTSGYERRIKRQKETREDLESSSSSSSKQRVSGISTGSWILQYTYMHTRTSVASLTSLHEILFVKKVFCQRVCEPYEGYKVHTSQLPRLFHFAELDQ